MEVSARRQAPAGRSEVVAVGCRLASRAAHRDALFEHPRRTGIQRDVNGSESTERRAARPEGHRLIEGRDAGGRRDFLNGWPVHAGQGLYLLTVRGWLPVRYESNMRADVPGLGAAAVLYLELPGAAREVVFAVPRDAALAWPNELTAPDAHRG